MIKCCYETISLPWRNGDLYLLHSCPDAYSGSLSARLSLSRRNNTPKLSSRDLNFRFDFDRPDRSRSGPFCGMFRKAITFSETDLSVKSDFPRGLRIDQYAVRVRYEDIVDPECPRTKPHAPGYVSYALPILLIRCKYGKTRKISLRCFSKGQRKKIIEELILRVESTGKTLPVRSAELLLSKVKTR